MVEEIKPAQDDSFLDSTESRGKDRNRDGSGVVEEEKRTNGFEDAEMAVEPDGGPLSPSDEEQGVTAEEVQAKPDEDGEESLGDETTEGAVELVERKEDGEKGGKGFKEGEVAERDAPLSEEVVGGIVEESRELKSSGEDILAGEIGGKGPSEIGKEEKEGETTEEQEAEGAHDKGGCNWGRRLPIQLVLLSRSRLVLWGATVFVAITALVGFMVIPSLRSSGRDMVQFLDERAGAVYDMKFFLPLKDDAGRIRFAKFTLVIEVAKKEFVGELEAKLSEIRKEIIDIVLTKSAKEMKTIEGRETLKREITTHLNSYLSNNCVKGTYFTELIVL